MLRNGRPYSNENGYGDAGLITSHSEEEQETVFRWIRERLAPRKTVNYRHTSYGLKHLMHSETGIYLTNNEFKDAMMICGYMPSNPNELNWHYRISEKSPFFTRCRR